MARQDSAVRLRAPIAAAAPGETTAGPGAGPFVSDRGQLDARSLRVRR